MIDAQDPTRIEWTSPGSHPGAPAYRAACTTTSTNGGRLLALGGSGTAYNISGTGYRGEVCVPLEQLLVFDPETGRVRAEAAPTGWGASMDHRGLVALGDGRWMVVGGMSRAGRASARAQILRFHDDR